MKRMLGWRVSAVGRISALAAASAIFGLVWLATALRHNMGFPLDDSWIHQEIARNLIQFHSFGFIPMRTSSGSSSLLWTLLLSLNYLLVPRLSPVAYALLLNAALFIGASVLLACMAQKDKLPLPEALALAVLPGVSGNWVWLAFTGMEHVLFVTLSLLTIVLWFRSPARAYWSGLTLGLLALTRPEGLGLWLLLFVCFRLCGRRLVEVIQAGAVAAVIFLPSLELNRITSGALLPSTMQGRRFLYFGAAHLHPGFGSFKTLAFATYRVVLAHNFFALEGRWIPAFALLGLGGIYVLLRRFPSRTALLCAWAILDYLSYAVMLPSPGHAGRYQPFVLVLFAPLMAIGAIALLRTFVKSANEMAQQRVGVVTVVVAAALTAITLPRWRAILGDGIADINGCHRVLAQWMDSHLPADTKVAAFDIGAIGYFSHVQVIDLGGLVDPRFLPYLMGRDVPNYLRQQNVQYVMLPHDADNMRFADELNLLRNPAIQLQPVVTEHIDFSPWKEAFDCTQNALWMQTLYRVSYAPVGVPSRNSKQPG